MPLAPHADLVMVAGIHCPSLSVTTAGGRE
jgi:hypothetical protein